MITDLHSHYFPLEAVRQLPDAPVQVTELGDGTYRLVANGHAFTLDRSLFELDQQRSDLRRQGLDARNLMPPPFTLLYELPPDDGVRWSRALNDAMAAAAAAYPNELIGFATVPLQDVPAAVEEARRAAQDLNLRGIEIATSVNGVGLDDPSLDPFWEVCQALGLPILIHPHYVSGAERMGGYHLRNLIGNPAETALAGARLLFGGVLERFPALHIILSHGGGALPHLVGRLRHGYRVRPECQERASAPIEHMSRLFYDTIVFDHSVLRHVAETVGTSQLILGTDYPFDMSEDQPVAFIRGAGFSDEETCQILNAGDRLIKPASAHR